MADTKALSNQNLDAWFILESGVANPASPTAAEINAGQWLTPAVAFDGSTFPNATDSNDVDDRGWLDAGNASTRGYEQYEATLNFFRPRDLGNVTSDYVQVFEAMRLSGVKGYLVTRVLQRNTSPVNVPAAAGDWISVYKVQSDAVVDDTEGEDSYKYAVNFLPQGGIYVYTQVKTAAPVVVAPATISVAEGAYALATATLLGKSITQGATWTSSDPDVATVSPNGVVLGVSDGTATISASHPAATAAGTTTVTVA